MDPEETLAKILTLVSDMREGESVFPGQGRSLVDMGTELAMHVEALDQWLSRGGFLPERWSKAYSNI
jgi:hypothetical protein